MIRLISIGQAGKLAIAGIALLGGLGVGGGSAYASEDTASCEVLEVRASHGESDRLDPRLRPIEDKLEQPPFRDWNVFEALGAHSLSAERRKPADLSLAPGGEITLLYRDLIRSEGKKPRLRISLTLDDDDGKRVMDATIKLDSGDWYLVGGDSLDDDATYILATSCSVDDG